MDVSHVTLLFNGLGSGGSGDTALFTNLMIPGSGSGSGFFGSDLSIDAYGSSFVMLGLGSGSGSGGNGIELVVSMGGLTYIGGDLFVERFPGYSEQEIINSLLTGTSVALDFIHDQYSNIQTANGSVSPLVAFSEADTIGSISFSVVIVPAPPVLASLPFLFLCGRRRR